MPSAEGAWGFADARGFVDFKAQAVARAVEEALHAAVCVAGFKVAVFKEFLECAVDGLAVCVCADAVECEVLGREDRVVDVLEVGRGVAFDDGAGEVGEVAGDI